MRVYHDFFCYPYHDPRFLKWNWIRPNDTDPKHWLIYINIEDGNLVNPLKKLLSRGYYCFPRFQLLNKYFTNTNVLVGPPLPK